MKKLAKLPTYIGLIVFAVAALSPFQYMLATAMTPQSYSMPYPPILFPQSAYFGNFVEAWNANHFSRYFLNSLLVAAAATVIIMLVSSAGAYAFARISFPVREFVFYLYLFTMMVPTVTNLIPQFLLMKDLKLVDSYLGLLLIYIWIGVPSNTFFLRNFFLSLPREMEEAVIVDGGNHWQIYWRIVLPLSKPALATVGLFYAINRWNSYFWAMQLLNDDRKAPLQVLLKKMIVDRVANASEAAIVTQNSLSSPTTVIYAMIIIAIVPMLIVFPFVQKYFKTGVTVGGVKG